MAYQREPAAVIKDSAGHYPQNNGCKSVFRQKNNADSRKDSLKRTLTQKEKKLIQLIRDTGYGEARIIVQEKQPVRIRELKKSIKL